MGCFGQWDCLQHKELILLQKDTEVILSDAGTSGIWAILTAWHRSVPDVVDKQVLALLPRTLQLICDAHAGHVGLSGFCLSRLHSLQGCSSVPLGCCCCLIGLLHLLHKALRMCCLVIEHLPAYTNLHWTQAVGMLLLSDWPAASGFEHVLYCH